MVHPQQPFVEKKALTTVTHALVTSRRNLHLAAIGSYATTSKESSGTSAGHVTPVLPYESCSGSRKSSASSPEKDIVLNVTN